MITGLIVENQLGNFFVVFGSASNGAGVLHFRPRILHKNGFIDLDQAREHLLTMAPKLNAQCLKREPVKVPVSDVRQIGGQMLMVQ